MLCDFKKVKYNTKDAIELFDKSVKELEAGNFKDIVGMVSNDLAANALRDLDRFNLIEEE